MCLEEERKLELALRGFRVGEEASGGDSLVRGGSALGGMTR